jgi:hypothetical protein
LLVPREHKVDHTNAISRLSDEELKAAIKHNKDRWRRAPANEDLDLEPLLVDMERRVRFTALPKEPFSDGRVITLGRRGMATCGQAALPAR